MIVRLMGEGQFTADDDLLGRLNALDDQAQAAVDAGNEPELDRLSNILKMFNEQFGTLFTDTDRVAKRIRDDIAPKVAADVAYQNAMENTPHTARKAHDQALGKVMQILLKDDTQVYKQFVENESFKRFVADMVFALTSQALSVSDVNNRQHASDSDARM